MVIGGSALALGYGVGRATQDIDTCHSQTSAMLAAAAIARAQTGLGIPLQDSTVAQLPPDYESRLKRVLPDLDRLTVYVVEAHDLAASKLLRGNEHDRAQLAELHQRVPLELDVLVQRYRELLAVHVGDPTEPIWSFFHFVEEIWGELAAEDARAHLSISAATGHGT